jgi:hypothetical protein
MTVTEMKDICELMEEQGHGDKQMVFVYQQNYPLQSSIRGICVPANCVEELDETSLAMIMRDEECTREEALELWREDMGKEDWGKECLDYVYIVEGGQLRDHPYGPAAAWDNVEFS